MLAPVWVFSNGQIWVGSNDNQTWRKANNDFYQPVDMHHAAGGEACGPEKREAIQLHAFSDSLPPPHLIPSPPSHTHRRQTEDLTTSECPSGDRGKRCLYGGVCLGFRNRHTLYW